MMDRNRNDPVLSEMVKDPFFIESFASHDYNEQTQKTSLPVNYFSARSNKNLLYTLRTGKPQ